MTEDHIHRSILKYLRSVLPHSWLVIHVPNGGSRHPIEAARMKGLGVVAGWPDLSIFGDTGSYFLEVKSAKGRLSNCQHMIIDKLKDAGFPVAIVRSLDDVRDFIEQHSLPSREVRQ